MSKKIQLTIAEPCHENWDAMTDVQKGKFCGSCQKQVVDFTNMSDRQLAEFFKKPSTGSVCGRFMSDQLERELEIPKKRIPWLKYFFTIAIPAFFASKVSAQQQPKTMGKVLKPAINKPIQTAPLPEIKMLGEVAPIEITTVKKDTAVLPEVVVTCNSNNKTPAESMEMTNVMPPNLQTALTGKVFGLVITTYTGYKNNLENTIIDPSYDARKRTIIGHIVNEKGESMAGASILIKGTKVGAISDSKGEFRILAKTGDLLVVSGSTFMNAEFVVTAASYLLASVTSKNYDNSEVIIVTAGMVSVKRFPQKKTRSTAKLRCDKTEKAANKNKLLSTNTLKIFPNPVAPQTTVTISLLTDTEEGYYTYQLTSLSGQSIHQQEIWIDKTAKVLSLDIPAVTAGTYLLTLIHKKTNHKFSEKIVVQ